MQESYPPTQQNCAFITLYLFSMPISRGICESWEYRCNVKRCLCTTLRCRDYTLRRFFIYLSGAAQRQKKLSAFALDRRRDNNMYADTRALLYICGVIVLPLSFCYICPVILNTDRRSPSRKERGTEVSFESLVFLYDRKRKTENHIRKDGKRT